MLPYTENLVNIVVAGSAEGISLEEVYRVLAPNGVFLIHAVGMESKLRTAAFNYVETAPELAGWIKARKLRLPEI
jgi:acetylglutamate kinase